MRDARLGRAFGPVALFAMLEIGAWLPAVAVDKNFDLDGTAATGNESLVSLTVVSTSPVKIRNKVTNKAVGQAFSFNWVNAGPGGFSSSVGSGTASGVGVIWDWSTTSTVYSFTGSTCGVGANDICFSRTSPGPVVSRGPFGVPGRSLSPSGVTLSTASLTSTLLSFFSPPVELVRVTSSVAQLACGQFRYNTRVDNFTALPISFNLYDLAAGPPPPGTPVIDVPAGGFFEDPHISPFPSQEVMRQIAICGGGIPDGPASCSDGQSASVGIVSTLIENTSQPVQDLLLSPVKIQVVDVNGNGLLEQGETVGLVIGLRNAATTTLQGVTAVLTSPMIDFTPDDGVVNPVSVNVSSATSPYPDIHGNPPGNPDCSASGPAPVNLSVNAMQFVVSVPQSHPADVGRPFNLHVSGNLGVGRMREVDVPIVIGIANRARRVSPVP